MGAGSAEAHGLGLGERPGWVGLQGLPTMPALVLTRHAGDYAMHNRQEGVPPPPSALACAHPRGMPCSLATARR